MVRLLTGMTQHRQDKNAAILILQKLPYSHCLQRAVLKIILCHGCAMVLLRAFFYVSSPEQELCFITGKGIWAMKIEMNNINKTIKGVSLLTDINLALESGHIYGFVGDNGSGKTVLFKVLLGLMHKTSGTILVDGREQKDLMQDVGFIIERPEYIPYYSAKKNLEIIAAYRKVADDQRICTVLEMFGLDPSDKKAVGKYSLGMKQKLALSMAFLEDPKVLILDEPLSALDADSVQEARKRILEEKERGKLVLIASHYPEDIQSLCDEVYWMKNGHVLPSKENK